MGQKSSTETIVALLKALLDRREWKQADLARHVGVSAATVHKRLVELQERGIPLESEKDHPHVWWSVPNNWYPGGVLFAGDEVTELFRQLSRLPRSKARDKLIASLIGYLPTDKRPSAIVPREGTTREEETLPIIEDSATRRVAMRFRYYTANRGHESARVASVHRVLPGPPARFVGMCHRSGTLKWFRAENVSDPKLDAHEPFRDVENKVVDEYVRLSLDGFHDGGKAETHRFFVGGDDAKWVVRNLMEGMQYEDVPGGIRVSLESAATSQLARFVVGLGASAKPLTPALLREVARLARGALESTVQSAPESAPTH